MPGLMYMPPWQPPALTGFMDLIQRAAIMRMAQGFQERQTEMEVKREETKLKREQLMKGKELEFQSALEGRDVVKTDAQQPPEGYAQSPYDPTTYVGPEKEKPLNVKKVSVDGKQVGIFANGKFYRTAEPKPQKKASLIEQYEYAKEQFTQGAGPNPGPFQEWAKAQRRAGAAQIGFGEKLTQKGLEQEQTKAINFKDYIRTPDFAKDTINRVKSLYSADDWRDMPIDAKTELIYQETETALKSGYPDKNVQFGVYKGKQGWWELDERGQPIGDHPLKKWDDLVPRKQHWILSR